MSQFENSISTMERNSFDAIIAESTRTASPERALPPATDDEVMASFNMADTLLASVNRMRKAIRSGGKVQDEQGLLRITTAALCYSQREAGRATRGRQAFLSAGADQPVAFHALVVEVYANETFRVRIDSSALEYENGELARQILTLTMMPSKGARTADQAAQDVIVGGRVLSQMIATTELKIVDGEKKAEP